MKTTTVRFVTDSNHENHLVDVLLVQFIKSLRGDGWLVGTGLSGDLIVAQSQPILEFALQQEKG